MIQRKFIIGSEWIYLKIYTGERTADRMISTTIAQLVDTIFEKSLSDKWFYIRYKDEGGFHLRLRFHLNIIDNIGQIIQIIYQILSPFIENGAVHSINFDTYVREIERYGADSYCIAEDLFYYNSIDCLKYISVCDPFQEQSFNRIRFTLQGIEQILNALSYDNKRKRDFCLTCRDRYRQEFKIFSTASKKAHNDLYRKYKKFVEESFLGPKNHLLTSEFIQKLEIEKLSDQLASENIQWDDFWVAIIHMMINRLFVSYNRKYEMIIYDFAFKYFDSIENQKNCCNNK